ncbi:MAG: hypothetical protein AAGC81_17490 [Pseudomonadota bacterium]
MSKLTPIPVGEYIKMKPLSDKQVEGFLDHARADESILSRVRNSLNREFFENSDSESISRNTHEIYNYVVLYLQSENIPISNAHHLIREIEDFVRSEGGQYGKDLL